MALLSGHGKGLEAPDAMSSVSNRWEDIHSLEDSSSSLFSKAKSLILPTLGLQCAEKQVQVVSPAGFSPFIPPRFQSQVPIKESVDCRFLLGARLDTETCFNAPFGTQATKLEESTPFRSSIQPTPDLHSPSGSSSGSQLITLSPIRKGPLFNMDNNPTSHASMAASTGTSTSSEPQIPNSSPRASAGQLTISTKRKRNLPGTPDPDAEVVALSPKTLMATNRFVCEICNKGFQRDQNLQLHRRGHNLPWKLRQRSSKEVKKRVYICPEPTCVHHDPSRALGDLTGIKKHFCRKHGEKKFKCDKCSKRYAVQSDWKAHLKTCGTREYRCDCGTLFSRRDSFITHRAFCDALTDTGTLPPLPSNQIKTEQSDQVGPSTVLQPLKSQPSDMQSPNSGGNQSAGNQMIPFPESMALLPQQRWPQTASQNQPQHSENELKAMQGLHRGNPRLGLCLGSGPVSQDSSGALSHQSSLNQSNPFQNRFPSSMNPLNIFDPNNLGSALLFQIQQQQQQQQQLHQHPLKPPNQLSSYSDNPFLGNANQAQNPANDFNLQNPDILGSLFSNHGSFQNFSSLGPNANLNEILGNVTGNRLGNMGSKMENNSQESALSGSISGNILGNLNDQSLLRNPAGSTLQHLTEQILSQGNGQQVSPDSKLQRPNQLRGSSLLNSNQMKHPLGINSGPTGGLMGLSGSIWPGQNLTQPSAQGQPQSQSQNQNPSNVQDLNQNQNRGIPSASLSNFTGTSPLLPIGNHLLGHQKQSSQNNPMLNQFVPHSLSEGMRSGETNTNPTNQGLQEFINMAAGNQGVFGAGGLASMFGSNAGNVLSNLTAGNELMGQGDNNPLQSMAASMQNLSRGSGEDLKGLNVVTRDFLGLARTISPRDFSQIRDLAALNASMEANNSSNLDKQQPQREILNNTNTTSGV